MSKSYLQGKVGTGLRAAWVGEKTTTSFAVYVLVRNMSSDAYNEIHGGALTNVGAQLDKTTNVKVRVKNLTTNSFATGTDASGNFTISDLAADPLTWTDASGNTLPLSDWTGLRIRRFEFTGLTPGTEYLMEPYTDAVNSNDTSTGKLQSFTFKVKTLSEDYISGFHFACDQRKWVTSGDWYTFFNNDNTWFDVADVMHDHGADIAVCQDDLDYASIGNSTNYLAWVDPNTVTGDTAETYANVTFSGLALKNAVLDVEEVATAATNTYTEHYLLVASFFRALLHPPTLITAMKSSLESTDSGDQFANRNNNAFHFADPDMSDAMVVDYGTQAVDLTTTKAADADTVNWLQDKDGGAVRNPYDQSGNTIAANFKTDIETCGTMQLNHKLLMEYFFGRAVPVTPPTSSSWERMYTDHTDYGTTLSLNEWIAKPVWRNRNDHPLVDLIYLNTTYWSDSNVLQEEIQDGDLSAYTLAPYPCLCTDTSVTKTLGSDQATWLATQLNASTKPFIIIFCADPLLQVDTTDVDAPYGQRDGIGQKSTSELTSLISTIQALTDGSGNTQGVLVLTGDHHVQGVSHDGGNILQCVSTSAAATLRTFNGEGSGFTGQYDATKPGFTRFLVTPNRLYAYTVEISSGNPLGSDVAYFEAGGNSWQFTNRSNHDFEKAEKVGSGLSVLRSN